jgi:glutamyl-tRNA synthetase
MSTSDRPLRFRFAPSPTGYFHVGGARTALFNWALAKRLGGTFVLRIEDTDEERNRDEWTQGILDALAWLGISQDDPTFEGPYFQSRNRAAHLAAAERLFAAGHAYYCDLTPDQIKERVEAAGGKGGYDGFSRDRGLGPGPGRVLRFRVPSGTTVVHDEVRGRVEFDNALIEDFVLLRGNGGPMFLLANVVDDIDQRVSHVIRAEEHLPNTPKQQMIWDALGVAPPVWAHVPVLVNEQRKKLSKRRDKVALEMYRDEGYTLEAMRNYLMTLGFSLSGDREIAPWEDFVAEFSLESVNKSPAFFDLKKLAAFNGDYIRMMSPEQLLDAVQPWFGRWLADHPEAVFNGEVMSGLIPLIQQRLVTLADFPAAVDFMFLPSPEIDAASWDKTMAGPDAAALVRDTITAYESVPWNTEALKAGLEALAADKGLKLGKAQAPVRVAVTGRTVGPPLFEALELMGRAEVLRRLRAALERIDA